MKTDGGGAVTLTFGSLFAGIGGIDLGLERAGMECKWQVEIDPYATRVLEKHWPNVRRYSDVRTVGATDLDPVDVLAGGFPCTDISNAGRREGIGGKHSGLWFEFARIIGELRPRYVLMENVPALLGRGLDVVLGDLAEIGYDAEWQVLSACSFGAPHTRERVFIVAYPQSEGWNRRRVFGTEAEPVESLRLRARNGGAWAAESRPVGVAYGSAGRMERLIGLGNAVVPWAGEYVGRCIVAADELIA